MNIYVDLIKNPRNKSIEKKSTELLPDRYLSVSRNTATGLIEGLLFVKHPTPSGACRYVIARVTDGYLTARSAAIKINSWYPELLQIDVALLPVETDEDVKAMIANLPIDAFITHITVRDNKTKMEPKVKPIEVRAVNSINAPVLDVGLSESILKYMIDSEILELESTSGNDQDLYYRYDHYQFNLIK